MLKSQILHVLSIDPVAISEESQLNWALLISALWPINVWIFLDKNTALICSVYPIFKQVYLSHAIANKTELLFNDV